MIEKNLEQDKLLTLESPEILKIKSDWDEVIKEITLKLGCETEIPEPYDLERATIPKIESQRKDYGFIMISAPSGGGKGTIGKSLENKGIEKLPRYTTREFRTGEVDGKDYFFISDEKFEEMNQSDEFLPNVETHGKRRATSKKMLKEWVDKKKQFYVEGSTGAYDQIINTAEVKEAKPLSIFLLPPSFEEHFNRLTNRPDTISREEIIERLKKAVEHLKQTLTSDYSGYIVNDNIERVTNLIIENY